MSYVGVPQDKNNEVSGLTALARNIGGSLGVSFISTMLIRRAQTHQQFLSANVYGGSMKIQVNAAGHGGGTAGSRIFLCRRDSPRRSKDLRHDAAAGHRPRLCRYGAILVVMTACLIPIGYLMKKPRFRTKPAEPIE